MTDKRPMTDEEMALELRKIMVGIAPDDDVPPWDVWLQEDQASALEDLANVRKLLCQAENDDVGGEEVAMPRLERALWYDHEGNQLSKAELAIIDAARADLADAVRVRDAEVELLRAENEAYCQRDMEQEAEITDFKQQVERLTKERDELKAKAQAACTVEPLSAEEIAKLVKHYFETDMGYTGFDLARDVAAAQRAKAKAAQPEQQRPGAGWMGGVSGPGAKAPPAEVHLDRDADLSDEAKAALGKVVRESYAKVTGAKAEAQPAEQPSTVLARIRELAIASTSPSHREAMPRELDELLFQGQGPLPYAEKKPAPACTVPPLSEAEIDNIVLKWRYVDIGQKEMLRKVAEAQRAKVRPVELPTVSRDELGRTVRDTYARWADKEYKVASVRWDGMFEERYREPYRQCGEAVLDLLRERMGGGK
jgi:hypothetical protein